MSASTLPSILQHCVAAPCSAAPSCATLKPPLGIVRVQGCVPVRQKLLSRVLNMVSEGCGVVRVLRARWRDMEGHIWSLIMTFPIPDLVYLLIFLCVCGFFYFWVFFIFKNCPFPRFFFFFLQLVFVFQWGAYSG